MQAKNEDQLYLFNKYLHDPGFQEKMRQTGQMGILLGDNDKTELTDEDIITVYEEMRRWGPDNPMGYLELRIETELYNQSQPPKQDFDTEKNREQQLYLFDKYLHDPGFQQKMRQTGEMGRLLGDNNKTELTPEDIEKAYEEMLHWDPVDPMGSLEHRITAELYNQSQPPKQDFDTEDKSSPKNSQPDHSVTTKRDVPEAASTDTKKKTSTFLKGASSIMAHFKNALSLMGSARKTTQNNPAQEIDDEKNTKPPSRHG